MNRKQMVVVWIMAVLFSAALVDEGQHMNSSLVMLGGPVLTLGATLIYQFRDKSAAPRSIETTHLVWVVAGLLFLQTLLAWSTGKKLENVESSIDNLGGHLELIQSDVSSIEGNTSNLGQ